MSIPPPPLDSRDYAQLLADARSLAGERAPGWTDMTAGDPGEVLLELFAFLTESMIYRVNRLPERMYVAFLNLIGVSLEPPSAADVLLRFTLPTATDVATPIPRGTRAGSGGGQPAGTVFATVDDAVIDPGQFSVDVRALACEEIEGELLGLSNGQPGQILKLAKPPVIARANRRDQPVDARDLSIGVSAQRGEAADLRFAETGFLLWQEVASFADAGTDALVYLVDRVSGTVTFGPAVRDASGGQSRTLGAVPPAGREIRAWYRRGGGAAGNVAAGTLTRLIDPVGASTVTNPAPATGGRDPENVADALVRGPAQLFALQRAVTARDFELAARNATGAVTRAKAITQAQVWAHGTPGTVEVLLVPAPPDPASANAATLVSLQTQQALERVAVDLESRRALGTRCVVSWAHYKTVGVQATAIIHQAADAAEVHSRLMQRLQQTISPVASGAEIPGWPFGQALRASDVYATLLAEPSVRFVENVSLTVDEVPDTAVASLVADANQPHTWYCGSQSTLFRSMDDGAGWEASGRFEGESVESIVTTSRRPGLVVAACRIGTSERSRVRLSWDCGENWAVVAETEFHVEDMTVIPRDGRLVLMMATDRGLFELVLAPGTAPTQVLVDATNQTQGYYAVEHIVSDQGQVSLVLAAQNQRGIVLSAQAGRAGTFQPLGLQGKDIRVLVVRNQGPRRLLLAGVTVESGEDAGEGAHLLEIQGAEISPSGWQPLGQGWTGGSCRGLVIVGDTLVAASHRLGVLRWDLRAATPSWRVPSVDSGLPLRDLPSGQTGRFEPVTTVAAAADGSLLLVGGAKGVFASVDGATSYVSTSQRVFRERVTLPATWLFCSGAHQLEVRVASG
jgi:hypothetical protein